ncbi:MAG: hypothetical protein WCF04_01050 [Candidatus Nanopelagicales bacterium]
MRGFNRATSALALGAAVLLGLGGCSGEPAALPTIGSPSPSPTPSPTAADRSSRLATQWQLTGVPLPNDWPDVPLPSDTEVVTAYAIGSDLRRTWTATFAGDTQTALQLAEPLVAGLRAKGFTPVAEYVGPAETNTGLYSFATPTMAVYVVLGEDAGRPNLVVTVRGAAQPGPDQSSAPAPSATKPPSSSSTPAPPAAANASPAATTP